MWKLDRMFVSLLCLTLFNVCVGDGLAEVVKLSPVGMKEAKPTFRLLCDTPEMFAMVLESSQSPVKVTLRPAKFPIKAGVKYWVENYFVDPVEVLAQSDGVLELDYPAVNYNQLMISPTQGNLLKNPSFELVKGNFPQGWEINSTTEHLPCRNWWSGMGAGPGPAIAVCVKKRKGGGVNDAAARTGNNSLFLEQNKDDGSRIAISDPISLASGKEYFLRGYFNLQNLKFGSDPGFLIELSAQGKSPIYRYALFYPRNMSDNQWGAAYLRCQVPADWKDPKGRIILTVSGEPFSIQWDDFDLRETPKMLSQAPKVSPVMDKVGGDVVKAKIASIKPYTAKVVEHNGTTALEINGQIIPKVGYLGFRDSGHGAFADIGVNLQWLYLPAGNTGKNDWRGGKLWIADGKFDFSSLDSRLAKMLRLAPDAYVMLYLICDPYPEFGTVHPEAVTLDKNNKTSLMEGSGAVRSEPWHAYWYTADSAAYRREVCKMLNALGEHLKNSPYGKVVAGVHLAGSHDAQYFPKIYDGSEGYRRSFADYLRKIYNNDVTTLQKAWNNPIVTFDYVRYPKKKEFVIPNQYFLDPEKGLDRRLIDASRFREQAPVETLNMMAKSLKKAIGRSIYVSTYYNDFIAGWDLGKNAMRDVLNSAYIDGVTSVIDYAPNRLTGCPGGRTSLFGSLRLHRKLQLAEIDYRTEYSETWTPRGIGYDHLVAGGSHGIDENNAQLRRDLGQALTQQQGAWFYSLTGQGWATTSYLDNLREGIAAATISTTAPQVNDQGQIGVFFDEHELDYLSRSGKLSFRLAFHQISSFYLRRIFNVSGLSWDGYLLSDLEHPDRVDYKVNIFPVAASLTDNQIEWIEKNLQKDGKVNVFCFDAGRLATGGFTKNIERLTGIRCVIDEKTLVNYGLAKYNPQDKLSMSLEYPFTDFRGPLISVADSTAVPLARLAGTDSVVAAVKRYANWTGIYIAVPSSITPKFLREVALEAGITPIGPGGDATYAGNGFLVIHAMTTGKKVLQWKEKSDIFDLISGKIIAKNVYSYSCEMKAGETRWFHRTLR